MPETHNSSPNPSPNPSMPRTPLLIALFFSLFVVALLVVDEHTNWLELRVGSGTAAAMALAADPAPANR